MAREQEKLEWDQGRIDCDLAQLDGLTVKEVSTQPGERAWVRAALRRFHYLGFGGAVGENLQYVVRDGAGAPVGLSGVWGGGLEVSGPGPVYRLVGRAAAKEPGAGWPTTRVF